ncbi:MAG: hypothetical protein EPO61_15655 [Nitrospirae bacterium]|nr:MAG: hypothetical protein EPO61_15655 [Nitrospirota bacterium]
MKAHQQGLASLASDAQAQTLFASSLGAALNLKDGPPTGKPGARSQPQSDRSDRVAGQAEGSPQTEWGNFSLRLTAELAAWNLAVGLREAADKGDQALQTLVRANGMQHSWLTGTNQQRERLRRAFLLAETLTAFAPTGQPTGEGTGSLDYAADLDRAMPLTGADNSWLTLAERTGATGLRQRLRSGAPSSSSEPDMDRLAQTYFETRLKPVFVAQVIALALRAEAEAERNSREAWLQLRTWRDRQRESKGLARLCGTWQWTIHNHQNHQDHKMVMVFAPPPETQQAASAQGMKPAKIVVLGEGVYLRWESAGGYQEDSLLFTSEGQRLEGSFVNSAGAWGSITGKRVAACKN